MYSNHAHESVTQPHIVIVDETVRTRERLVHYLSREGYRVTACETGDDALNLIESDPAALVLLCKPLHSEPLFNLIAAIARIRNTAIIVMSDKDEMIDRIAGFECGADDYVQRAIHDRELLARIRSRLRRLGSTGSKWGEVSVSRMRYRFGNLSLDPLSRKIQSPRGDVDLSESEFRLLVALLRNPHEALSRQRLVSFLHDDDLPVNERSVDVQIGRLRGKIEPMKKRPKLIKTVRSAGYMLDVEVQRN